MQRKELYPEQPVRRYTGDAPVPQSAPPPPQRTAPLPVARPMPVPVAHQQQVLQHDPSSSTDSGHMAGGRRHSISSYSDDAHDAHDTGSEISSRSSRSSLWHKDLDLCPNDLMCTLVNDKDHQRQYVHTCRLNPCYHAAVRYHAKLFRHTPGQEVHFDNLETATRRRRSRHKKALASVSFKYISHDIPNAVRLIVDSDEMAYEICGDWTQVRVHTLKRYLHQVTGVAPQAQILTISETNTGIEDELAYVSDYRLTEGMHISVRDNGVGEAPPVPPIVARPGISDL